MICINKLWIIIALLGLISFLLRKHLVQLYVWIKYRLDWKPMFTVFLAISIISTAALTLWIECFHNHKEFLPSVFLSLKYIFNLLEGDSNDFFLMTEPHIIEHILAQFLALAVPVLTASTVFIYLLHHMPRSIPFGNEYYIFSHLDKSSILLANDLHIHSGKKKFVFIFLRTQYGEQDSDSLMQLKGLRYRFYPHTEADLLSRYRRLRKDTLRFFFLSDDTDKNFDRMDKFLNQVSEKRLFKKRVFQRNSKINQKIMHSEYTQELYLLSETASAPLLIDKLRQNLCTTSDGILQRKDVFRHTELRLFDRYRAINYHLLREVPLHTQSQNFQNKVLLLGFGHVGQEFFRAASSFSIMVNHNTSFVLCDRNINIRCDALSLQYPECFTDTTYTTMRFDAESSELIKLIESNLQTPPSFTYIVVALGDDELNIRIATKLRRHYRKLLWERKISYLPVICVNVEDKIKSDYTQTLFPVNDKLIGDSPLCVFGTDEETFSTRVLMPRGQWTAAQKLHTTLTGKNVQDLPVWTEYERRSSIASVCHATYHIASTTSNHDSSITEAQYKSAFHAAPQDYLDSEHERWMHYVRSEGMQQVNVATVAAYRGYTNDHHVDIAGQLTPCLVSAGDLDQLHDTLAIMFGWTHSKYTFRERDELIVQNAWKIDQIIQNNNPQIKFDLPARKSATASIP